MTASIKRLLSGIVLILILLNLGCSGITDKNPSLSDSLLVNVLTEIHLADARIALDADVPEQLRDSVLEKFGVSKNEFDESIVFLAEHPDRLAEIYGQVVDRLVAESKNLN